MIDGPAFVTPHAVRRFQERIRALPYEAARQAVIDELAEHVVSVRPAHAGRGVMVRVRGGRHSFRAHVLPPPGPALAPVVATVLRSGR